MTEYKYPILRAPVSEQMAHDVRLLVESICLAIWASYGSKYDYVSEKSQELRLRLAHEDLFDAVQFSLNMFDVYNQGLFANFVSDLARQRGNKDHVAWLDAWVEEVLIPQLADGLSLFASLEEL